MDSVLSWSFLVVFFHWPGVCGFQWESSSLEEGDSVYACVHGTATFGWSFSSGGDEEVFSIQWVFHSAHNQVVAMFASGAFIPLPAYAQRVHYVSSGTITLGQVGLEDAGNYSVEVSVRDSSGAVSHFTRTARLRVGDGREDPELAGSPGALVAYQERRAVKDATTGEWHVELSCGIFVSRGYPPVEVTWTSPLGQTLPSTTYESGKFSLLLPNPVAGGRYACRVSPESPAVLCLADSVPVLQEASVTVDGVEARLSLLEARDGDLEAENAQLLNALGEANRTIDSLKQQLSTVQGDMAGFKAVVDKVAGVQRVRLADGPNSRHGRVEVYVNGVWGTVCDDSWDDSDAQVICRMLGYSSHGATAYGSAYFGDGSGSIFLDEVRCNGTETHINYCPSNPIGDHDCSHSEDASVGCLL